MHRLAVVTERFLREPFRIAALFGALRPRVAIGVKRDAFDAESITALLEFRGAVASANRLQIRKQRAGFGQTAQDGFNVSAEVDHRQASGFPPRVGDGSVRPVNVLRRQTCDVTLRSAEMPAQLVEVTPFRVLFALNDELMFLDRDRKSTRLNSSHVAISYAVFCLKKKT